MNAPPIKLVPDFFEFYWRLIIHPFRINLHEHCEVFVAHLFSYKG